MSQTYNGSKYYQLHQADFSNRPGDLIEIAKSRIELVTKLAQKQYWNYQEFPATTILDLMLEKIKIYQNELIKTGNLSTHNCEILFKLLTCSFDNLLDKIDNEYFDLKNVKLDQHNTLNQAIDNIFELITL